MKKLLVLLALLVGVGFAVPVVADTSSLESIQGINPRTIRKAKRAKQKPNAGDLSKVCKNIRPFSGALLKNAWPGHIQRSDPRAPGFALVCASLCPRKFPASAYYSDGSLAFRLGYYGLWEGNHRPRAYCGAGGVGSCSASGVSSAARKSGRDGYVYVDFGAGLCLKAKPGIRNGGV